jgi:hypothetical protein
MECGERRSELAASAVCVHGHRGERRDERPQNQKLLP